MSYSAKVSSSFGILDLFRGFLSVLTSPSLFHIVNTFFSVTSSPKTLKKAQVFPTWHITSFHSVFPTTIALSRPPPTQSFPESFLSLQSPYVPLPLTPQFTPLCLPPTSQALKSLCDHQATSFLFSQGQFIVLILLETSAAVMTTLLCGIIWALRLPQPPGFPPNSLASPVFSLQVPPLYPTC